MYKKGKALVNAVSTVKLNYSVKKVRIVMLLLIAVIMCFSFSACGKDSDEEEEDTAISRERDRLSKEEIKQTLGIISEVDPKYRNGSISEREDIILDLLNEWISDGSIEGNISEEGTVIWFQCSDGGELGFDVSKDSLMEGERQDLPAPFGKPESIGGDNGEVVRAAVINVYSLAGSDTFSKCMAVEDLLRNAQKEGYVSRYRFDYVNGIAYIGYPNGDEQSFYASNGTWSGSSNIY